MVGKCIEEGIVDGHIDHAQGIVYSKTHFDIGFSKTMEQYHTRMLYCNEIHDAAVKAMKYKSKFDMKKMEEAMEQERELVNEIEDGDLDDEMEY